MPVFLRTSASDFIHLVLKKTWKPTAWEIRAGKGKLSKLLDLVRTDDVLLRVELLDSSSSPLLVPVEAFDGNSILEPLADRQRQLT